MNTKIKCTNQSIITTLRCSIPTGIKELGYTIYIFGKYALFLAGVSRMSKMLFPSIQFIITGLQFQMSINTQSTNTQIQFVTKCQKDQTYALFLNSWCFQDVRNCVPKCLIQKYRNKDTQIQLYTIHIP